MPKVSIIIPSYNHASFLKDRLDSIVDQSYKDWELIIIDDKSTDNSFEILSEFIEENEIDVKHFIVNEINSKSGYFSWEKGIELAQTEYIWIAETDDYSSINFLEDQIKALEKNKECVLSFCASNYVDAQKFFLSNTDKRTKDLNVPEGESKVFNGKVFINKMPFDTYIPNGSSVVFRKPKSKIPFEIFLNRQCSDIFLWTYLLQNSSFIFINKKMNFFRRHEESTTTKISTTKALINTYKELILYLKFFNLTDKNQKFIQHYFDNYVWKNKRDFFNFSVFENNKHLKKLYLKKVFFLTLKNFF